MAATIGKLVVTLQARTAKFRKSMKRVSKRIGAFATNLRQIGTRVAKFGAIVAGAALAGMAFFTKKAFETIDVTAKLSKQIGISIDGLRGLGRAAEITGAGQASLQKGLGFLGKALGEAKSGLGEGKAALESLGLAAEDIIDLPMDKTFGIIADRMNNLATQSEKAFVASKLFGRGGLALVNTLALGSRGLEEMAQKSLLLQGSLSDFDAGKVEEANDAIADMRMSFTGLFDRVAVAVAPFVQSMADRMTKLMVWWREKVSDAIPRILDWFKSMAVGAAVMAEGIWQSVKQIPANMEIAVIEAFKIWSIGLSKMKATWLTFAAVFETGWQGVETVIADVWDNVKISFFNAITWIGDKLAGFAQWVIDVLPGKNEWAQGLVDGYREGLDAVDSISDNIEKRSQKRWREFWKTNEVGAVQFTRDMDKLNQEAALLQKTMTEKQGALFGDAAGKTSASWIEDIFSDISAIDLGGAGDAFEAGGKMAGKAFVDAAKTFTTPGAIEAGTVEAYSATVRASYKSLADNGKKTVDELKESNTLQRETNREIRFLGAGNILTETRAFA